MLLTQQPRRHIGRYILLTQRNKQPPGRCHSTRSRLYAGPRYKACLENHTDIDRQTHIETIPVFPIAAGDETEQRI